MKVSIISPVFNSSSMLEELVQRINKTMDNLNLQNNYELVLINDASKDDSWKIIVNLVKKFSFVKGINLKENFGQHNAIMAGLNNCTGEFIITIDDDLQHPPEFISDILNKLKTNDVCYTNYRNRKHLGWKKFASNLNNIISSFILNKPLKIYMSSYRGMVSKIKFKIIQFKNPDVYIDGLIIDSTKNIGMITVDHHARKYGESNYSLKKLLILWSNMILNFSFLPFRAASVLGITLKFVVELIRKKNTKKQFEIMEIKKNDEK
jgi:polyisoprenyl-phosphate glycosyltransferase